MKVAAVSTSLTKGVKKENQSEIRLEPGLGVVGDAHAGGDPKREVSLLALESIELMRTETGAELAPGDFAENITTSGLQLHTLPLGTVLKIGPEAVTEVTQIGKTCHHGCAIKQTTGSCIMPSRGIFVKVTRGGVVRPGDEIFLESGGEPR